jgi:hypothetical protein
MGEETVATGDDNEFFGTSRLGAAVIFEAFSRIGSS